jgi:hypothetical protein
MWVYLSTWIVQDGELPELGIQSRLADHGVRASGWVIRPTAPRDGFELAVGPDPGGDGTVTYRLTGTIEWARPDTWEWIVRVGGSCSWYTTVDADDPPHHCNWVVVDSQRANARLMAKGFVKFLSRRKGLGRDLVGRTPARAGRMGALFLHRARWLPLIRGRRGGRLRL